MKDIMLADTPVEQRAQILRDSCDEVVEKSYLSKFSQEETNELRANLVEVQIQMQELTENFDVVKADFKGKMKPLQERIGKMLDDLRKGGALTSSSESGVGSEPGPTKPVTPLVFLTTYHESSV